MTKEFDLQRFVDAQAPVYDEALAELRAGEKRTHWMWFVFPQHHSLGRSTMAVKYGLSGLAEARAYWAHDLLGQRLAECCDVLLGLKARSAYRIFGTPDDLKFRSCMTIFRLAVPAETRFERALEKYFDEMPDTKTIEAVRGELSLPQQRSP